MLDPDPTSRAGMSSGLGAGIGSSSAKAKSCGSGSGSGSTALLCKGPRRNIVVFVPECKFFVIKNMAMDLDLNI
jgi:hypothetical protein